MTNSATFVARFADGTHTRMTTHTSLNKLDITRGVKLSQYAYQSRTGREPPAIIEGHFEIDGTVLTSYDAETLKKEIGVSGEKTTHHDAGAALKRER